MVRISSEHLYVSLAISVLLIMGSTGNSAILRPDKGNVRKEGHRDEKTLTKEKQEKKMKKMRKEIFHNISIFIDVKR